MICEIDSLEMMRLGNCQQIAIHRCSRYQKPLALTVMVFNMLLYLFIKFVRPVNEVHNSETWVPNSSTHSFIQLLYTHFSDN